VNGLDERDVGQLLAREAPAIGSAGLRRILGEVTAFSTKPPAAEIEAAHLSAMTELAQGIAAMVELTGRTSAPESAGSPVIMATQPPETIPTPRRLALGLATPALATPLCIVALAFAGVSLPNSVRAPFDAAGIALPNQSGADAVKTAMERVVPYHKVPAHHRVHVQLNRGATAVHEKVKHKAPGSDGKAEDRGGGAPVLAAVGSSGPAEPSPSPAPAGAAVGTPPSPSGGGHPSPASGGGHPSPSSGGGHPSTPPLGGAPTKTLPVTAPEIRPGRGCGDANHLHLRAGECN
jgi:hypothetical protein